MFISDIRERMELVQILFLLFAGLCGSVDSVMFFLESNARKCLAEEIRKDVLVTGDYQVTEQPGQQVDINHLNENKINSIHVI